MPFKFVRSSKVQSLISETKERVREEISMMNDHELKEHLDYVKNQHESYKSIGDDESKVLYHELKIIRAENTKRVNSNNAKLARQFLKLQTSKKMALLQFKWVILRGESPETGLGSGFSGIVSMNKSDMICVWLRPDDLPTYSASLGFVHTRRREGCLSTRRRVCFAWSGVEKKPLRRLRHACARHLRPEGSSRPRSVLRGCTHLPGVRAAACLVPALWCSEAGETGLVGGQPFLYQALCVLRRPSLSNNDDLGCGARAASGLARSQRTGKAVYARAVAPYRHARAESHRHRRDIDPQGSYLPDCGERSDSPSPDLVRRRGSLGGEHGAVL